jgi:tetratricopeptide (TPR) repeat protein
MSIRNKRILLICFLLVSGILIIPVVESGYFLIKGLRALRQGFESESVRYLEKSIKVNPRFPKAYMLLALAYTEWGSSSRHYIEYDAAGLDKLKSETLGKAEDILKTALTRSSFHKDKIQYMLGWIYDEDARSSGYIWDKDKAVQGYTQLLSNYPHSGFAQKSRERLAVLTR